MRRLEQDKEEIQQEEEALQRQARPNHNPVVSGLSPEDAALPPTEEYDTRELLTRLGQYGMSEFGKPFSLTELPSLPDNRWRKD